MSPARLSAGDGGTLRAAGPLAGIVEETRRRRREAVGGGDGKVATEILGHQRNLAMSGCSAAEARAAKSPKMDAGWDRQAPRETWGKAKPRQVGESARDTVRRAACRSRRWRTRRVADQPPAPSRTVRAPPEQLPRRPVR